MEIYNVFLSWDMRSKERRRMGVEKNDKAAFGYIRQEMFIETL